MLGVGDGVPDDVLEEDLENTTRFLVDKAGDTLDTTSAGETTDGGLGDTLDVITQNLPVTLGATLSQAFSSFAASRHVARLVASLRRVSELCGYAPAGALLLCRRRGRVQPAWPGLLGEAR